MLCGGTLTEDAGDEDVVGAAADVNVMSNGGVFPLAESLDGVRTRSGPHPGMRAGVGMGGGLDTIEQR